MSKIVVQISLSHFIVHECGPLKRWSELRLCIAPTDMLDTLYKPHTGWSQHIATMYSQHSTEHIRRCRQAATQPTEQCRRLTPAERQTHPVWPRVWPPAWHRVPVRRPPRRSGRTEQSEADRRNDWVISEMCVGSVLIWTYIFEHVDLLGGLSSWLLMECFELYDWPVICSVAFIRMERHRQLARFRVHSTRNTQQSDNFIVKHSAMIGHVRFGVCRCEA